MRKLLLLGLVLVVSINSYGWGRTSLDGTASNGGIEGLAESENVFSGRVSQYPQYDYSSPSEIVFSLSEVASALETDGGTLAASGARFYLEQPDGTRTSGYNTNNMGFWMTTDGVLSNWGMEATTWCAEVSWNVSGDALAFSIMQFPEVLMPGTSTNATYVLVYGEKEAIFNIGIDVIPFSAIDLMADTISCSAVEVVAEHEIAMTQYPRDNYKAESFSVDIASSFEKLGVDIETVSLNFRKMLYTQYIEYDQTQSVNVLIDSLRNTFTASNTGWWFASLVNDDVTDDTKTCYSIPWNAEKCRFYLDYLSLDALNAELNGDIGQYPNTLSVGDTCTAEFYLVYKGKAIKFNINLTIEAKPTMDSMNLTEVGSKVYDIELLPNVDGSYMLDIPVMEKALGCTSSEWKWSALEPGKTFAEDFTANKGYWMNRDGYVCKWDSTRAFYTELGERYYGKDSIHIRFNSSLVTYQVGDVQSFSNYYVSGDKYYRVTVNITFVEEFTPVVDLNVRIQTDVINQTTDEMKTYLDMELVRNTIGEAGTDGYKLYGLTSSTDSTRSQMTDAYSCTPYPGFWMNVEKNNDATAFVGQYYLPGYEGTTLANCAFGMTYADSVITWYQIPGLRTAGDAYDAVLYLYNQETSKYIRYNVNVLYVSVEKRNLNVYVNPSDEYTNDYMKTNLDMESIRESIGEPGFGGYKLYGMTAPTDSAESQPTDQYTCNPQPGFWMSGTEGTTNAYVGQWGTSSPFAVTYADGIFTWYQYPSYRSAGEVYDATFYLYNPETSKAIQYDVHLSYVDATTLVVMPDTISTSDIKVIAEHNIYVRQYPRNNYDSDEVSIDLTGLLDSLGLHVDTVSANLANMLYTQFLVEANTVYTPANALHRISTGNAPGWWFGSVDDDKDSSKIAYSTIWSSGVSRFYLDLLSLDTATKTLKGNLGQYPGILSVGDIYTASFYLVHQGKAIKLNINLAIEAKPTMDSMNLIEVGSKVYDIELLPNVDGSYILDIPVMEKALGCTSSEWKWSALEPGNTFADGFTANKGYWMNRDGYVCSWDSTRAFYTELGERWNGKDSIHIRFNSSLVTYQVGDVQSFSNYYISGDTYYRVTVNITFVEEFTPVENLTVYIKRDSFNYTTDGMRTTLDMDVVRNAIGEAGTAGYKLYGLTIPTDSTRSQMTDAYSCTPYPGFWMTVEKGTTDSYVGQWGVNSFGMTYADGVITWYQIPAQRSVGDTYDATYYLYNPETSKYIRYNVHVVYVSVEELNLNVRIQPDAANYTTDDMKTVLDMEKIATFIGETENDYVLYGMSAPTDSTESKATDEYSCTPYPGFWMTVEDGTSNSYVGKWGTNSFGMSYADGVITWYQIPGQRSHGDVYDAVFYFYNPETLKAVQYNVHVEYVAKYVVSAITSDESMGSVTVEGTGNAVEHGTAVTVTAIPVEGYSFVNWTIGDIEKSIENPYTFAASANVVLIANFRANTYKVTYVVDGEEYKTVDVLFGGTIPAEETPIKEGYEFSGWSEIPETMPAEDITVIGSFSKIDGIIGVSADTLVDVYNLNGMKVANKIAVKDLKTELEDGIYIINGKKYLIK